MNILFFAYISSFRMHTFCILALLTGNLVAKVTVQQDEPTTPFQNAVDSLVEPSKTKQETVSSTRENTKKPAEKRTPSVSANTRQKAVDPLLEQRELRKNTIPFSFDKKKIDEILSELAAKKGINIILPQNASQLETLQNQTITYHPTGRTDIPVREAWDLLHTFLELSGFALSKKKGDLYTVEKIGKAQESGVDRSVLPLFANVAPEDLPNTQERIRYIYYLQNLTVPKGQDKDTNPIGQILKESLTQGAPIVFEPKTNAIIITDKANTIASVMHIIKELDHSGYRETVEVIHLNNTPAQDVVKIFASLKAAAGGNDGAPFIRSDSKTESLSYFAEDTAIVADSRQNNLIIMGRQSAVERIADFVRDHMDSSPESGSSILHYYDLQYLDAGEFAKVLTQVVSPLEPTGQQATTEARGAGPERYFQGVAIVAEEAKALDIKSTTEEITLEASGSTLPTGLGAQQKIVGGNRLIVAALEDDWLRIKNIIEPLDKPQPYVILEVMITDLRSNRQKLIAATIRSKTATSFPANGFQFLSSNISNVNAVLGTNPAQLQQDLLSVLSTENNPSLTSLLAPGSLIVSVNDPATPGVFGLFQVLDTVFDTKILSHPYVTTTNNQKATITSEQVRRRQGNAVPGAAGVTTIEIVNLAATLQIELIPRLSSLERLSLQIAVDINEFVDVNTDTRITRRINTNAHMESGEVLILGGLTRKDQTDTSTGTPGISRIPLFGNLFGRKNRSTTGNNLAIFVCPTIVHPKLRGGLNMYTADKIRKGRRDMDDTAVFGSTQDPITRIFFQSQDPTDRLITKFTAEASNPPDADLFKTSRERRVEARRPRTRPKKRMVTKPETGPVAALAA